MSAYLLWPPLSRSDYTLMCLDFPKPPTKTRERSSDTLLVNVA